MQKSGNPVLNRAAAIEFELGGEVGRRLQAVTEQWLLPAPEANPAMLAMFREREITPSRDLVPWAGEFAGKYLTHAVQILRLTGAPRLKAHLCRFTAELLSLQAEDGYLGCWPRAWRLTNRAPNASGGALTWDTWSHYHVMLGLLLWEELSGDAAALAAVVKIGDLICRKYLGAQTNRLVDCGSTEMNLAPVHALALLYRRTGTPRYLEMAEQIVREFSAVDVQNLPLAGDYLRAALAGKEFYQTLKPRWESLYSIMGLAELYYSTGREDYREAFARLWRSMLRGDRHNNGGFSSGEQGTGNPYDKGAIETCCTVAWMAMSVEMLRLTGDSKVADELEFSLLNSGLGLMSASGRWVTYNTPMDGIREASAQTIVFQARAGSPELNCCSVNGPRALGLLAEWALMQSPGGLTLNYYGPGIMTAKLASGITVRIEQRTDYPRDPVIELVVTPESATEFTLALRIPYWSENTEVEVDGEKRSASAGSYLSLRRQWQGETRLRLKLDFRLHGWRHPWSTCLGTVNPEPWLNDWLVIGPVRNPGDSPNTLPEKDLVWDGVTDEAKIRAAAQVKPGQETLNFHYDFPDAGKHAAAYAFTVVEAPQDGLFPVAFACDWWYACWVNGVKIEEGASHGTQPYCNRLELPLRAGRNLIAFRITGGSGGWNFTLVRHVAAANSTYASLYRGPLLLAYDACCNPGGFQSADAPILAEPELQAENGSYGQLLLRGKSTDGGEVVYCDFASAGRTGNYYQSWVPLGFACPTAEFTAANPRRSVRLQS